MAIQTFVASTVLTAAQMNALQANDYNQTVSTKTASYTLVAADKGTKVVMNAGATSTTITVNTSLFSAGDTLTILNTSTSGTCTITAGTATVASAGNLALGLNQGGTLYFTSAGVAVFQANGVTATASPIVQVVFASYATETTTTSTTYVTSGLTATITPTLNTSKVLVMATCAVQNFNSQDVFATVFRGTVAGTNLYGAAGFLVNNEDSGESRGGGAGNFLDSPATTSATTYTLGFKSETANVSKIQVQNTTSTLVLMEVLV